MLKQQNDGFFTLSTQFQDGVCYQTLYSGWQEMLAEHRQTVVEVQEIAEETGWRGPERHVNLQWDWRGGIVV